MAENLRVPVPSNQAPTTPQAEQKPVATQPIVTTQTQPTPEQPPMQQKTPTPEQIEAFIASDRKNREEIIHAKLEMERVQREAASVQSELARLKDIENGLKDPARRYSLVEQYGGDVVNWAESIAKGRKVSPDEEIAQLREKVKQLEEKTNKVETGVSASWYARELDKTLSSPKYAPILEFAKAQQAMNGTVFNLENAAQVAIKNGLTYEMAADQMLDYATKALGSIRAMFGQATGQQEQPPTQPATEQPKAPSATLTNAIGSVSTPVDTKTMSWEEREKYAMKIANEWDKSHPQ